MKATDFETQFSAMWNRSVDSFPGLKAEEISEDKARQEFKDDVDVNTILRRNSGVPEASRAPAFGDVDYDLTFREALDAKLEADAAWLRIPQEIRDKFPSWDLLRAGLESGDVKLRRHGPGDSVVDDLKKAAVPPEPVSPAVPVAAAPV